MEIRPTDLPLLISLDVLLKLKNVTRAAKHLNISQPALSAQLARLRTLFDDPLLQPSETGRGMVPTPRALELSAPLRDAIERIQLLGKQDTSFNPDCDSATFRISGTSVVINAIGSHLVRRVHGYGNPDIRVEFSLTDPEDAVRCFENGELDLLIGSERYIPAALRMRLFGRDNHVLVQRVGHPRGTTPITLESYCALNHVRIELGNAATDPVDEYLAGIGMHRRIVVATPHFGMAREILTRTDVVATIPSSLLDTCNDESLRSFALPFGLPDLNFAMGWHRRNDNDARHRWLRKCIQGYNPTGPVRTPRPERFPNRYPAPALSGLPALGMQDLHPAFGGARS